MNDIATNVDITQLHVPIWRGYLSPEHFGNPCN